MASPGLKNFRVNSVSQGKCKLLENPECKKYIHYIGVARADKGAMAPPKFLENIVILCFERRFSKQNSVI